MRAFKKLMAGMIATAIAATMATSAFAAELDANGKMVLSEGESYTAAGQTTVLVVPHDVWVNGALTGLEDADILYIDQWETAADAQAAIAAGLGVKLTDGELADINETEGAADYYVLFGGNTGTDGAFAITALEYVIDPEAETPVLKWCDVDGNGSVNGEDTARLLLHTAGIEALTYDAETLIAVCDIVKDGSVNGEDTARLLLHTAGIEALEGVE